MEKNTVLGDADLAILPTGRILTPRVLKKGFSWLPGLDNSQAHRWSA